MPDTPFKSMSREKRETLGDLWPETWHAKPSVRCEKCNGFIREGDWPFCRGQASDHRRD